VFVLQLGNSAIAEDIEIYVDPSVANTDSRPNVLFIVDNSGSMDTEVDTGEPWDADTVWPGDCDTNRIYWKKSSQADHPPDCGTSNWFNASANHCAATVAAFDSAGFYIDRAARWQDASNSSYRKWATLDSNKKDDYIECQADEGTHGSSSDPTSKPYAAHKGNGPWNSNSSNKIKWSGKKGGQSTYVLYSGNYLNWYHNAGSVTKTRLEIVQEVAGNLLDSLNNVNIGLMSFNYSQGGNVDVPIGNIADVRETMRSAINGYTAETWTPLAETLYEAALYFRGENVDFGVDSHAHSRTPSGGPKYKTPLTSTNTCGVNAIVLLTDGEPTQDGGADSKIKNLSGFNTLEDKTCSFSGDDCLDELADYLYNKDQATGNDMLGVQRVRTYTVGFQTDQQLLQDTATKGHGAYYTADDTAGLNDALTAVFADILAINSSFTAPAVSVNAFNRIQHRQELYFALFEPAADARWNGNVKRYKFDSDTNSIVDANDNAAIDSGTGQFTVDARSYWTLDADAPDGDQALEGGAAGKLTTTRKVYTYTGSTAPNNASILTNANEIHENNTALTADMLGLSDSETARRTEVLQWARGIDLLDEDNDGQYDDPRRRLGDPLHSKPVLITYGGTNVAPDITLYVATNEGYMHAIDTDDGTEVFSFMPQELLSNLPTLYDDASGSKVYGLDGPIGVWFNDKNENGLLLDGSGNLEAGERVYLYMGMRRGGNNYYALDVSDRSNPKLKWVISGGSGDFAELGQTWSKPIVAKVKLDGTSTDVLIFGGGYDPSQDDATTAVDDDEGRAIYMVDAETGARLWWAGPDDGDGDTSNDPDLILSNMTNSIPADITPVDINNDGFMDYFFAADVRGQVWRFDVDNDGNTGAGNFIKGGCIAVLGGNAEVNNRRFFNAPDVALIRNRMKGDILTIAIGSGFRAHPQNTTVNDRFYVLIDKHPFSAPSTYTAMTETDLYDATDNLIGEGTDAQKSTATAALASKEGWYIRLTTSGEKVLAPSLTFAGKLLFTSYLPSSTGTNVCGPNAGSGQLYVVNLLDATPVEDTDDNNVVDKDDRAQTLKRIGIAPEPLPLFTDKGPVIVVGTEVATPTGLDQGLVRTFWREN
jgi:type IV pilus assembly protein PilY1